MATRTAFNLETACRPNILALEPYRCARDDYKDDGTNILLDANENAYGPGLSLDPSGQLTPHTTHTNGTNGTKSDDSATPKKAHIISESAPHTPATSLSLHSLNRYPDPHQDHLKSLLCSLRQEPTHTKPNIPPLNPSNLFIGVGSDEAIDALIRCFCIPAHDRIMICPPTYGMYTVSACVNDIGVTKVPLLPSPPAPGQTPAESNDFALDIDTLTRTLTLDAEAYARDPSSGRIKLLFLTTPGNPTGALLPQSGIETLLKHPTFNGLIILDEAYIDFSSSSASLASLVPRYPNLVVMQTLSKAFGLAGIRCGAAFASAEVARVLNSMKAPYNVSEVTSQLAIQALQPKALEVMRGYRGRILRQRGVLISALPGIEGIGRFRGGWDANFLLVEVLDRPEGKPDNATALRVYEMLAAERGVVVRFRGKEHGCQGCLRVTVGTTEEVQQFLTALRSVLGEIYGDEAEGRDAGMNGVKEEKREETQSAAIP